MVKAMTGAEIAKEMGVTRQAISNTLKRTLEKLHKAVKKDNPDFDNFEAAASIMAFLNINDEESFKFFKLFPPYLREKIKEDAKNHFLGA